MDLNLYIYNVYELLKSSYKNIDFRSVVCKTNHGWYQILSILRFSNKTKIQLEEKYKKLNLNQYETERFKIQHEILDISKWENKVFELYEEFNDDVETFEPDYFTGDEPSDEFFEEFESELLTSSRWGIFPQQEVNKNSLINFYYTIPDKNEHHKRFNNFLKPEILKLGEDSVYEVINRVMELDGYSSHNSLYFSVIFPIYIEITELNYVQKLITLKLKFHEIFENAHIIFRIYSNPNSDNNNLKGKEEVILSKSSKNARELNDGYYENSIEIDFDKYNCIPNFQMRVWWKEIPDIHIMDSQYGYEANEFLKPSEILEVQEDTSQKMVNMKYQDIIGLEIPLEIEYKEIADEINKTYKRGFFDCVYILVRKLLENLLIDCLREYYTMSKIEKFYNDDKGRFLTLGRLRENFNEMIKEKNFKASVGQIPQEIVDYLEIFKETGNSSAHSFFSINHQYIIENNKDKLEIVLGHLTKIYIKLKSQSNEEDN